MPDLSDSSVALPAEAPARVQETGSAAAAGHESVPSLLAYPATYLLVGINVVVFVVMFRNSPALLLLRSHAWAGSSGVSGFLRMLWQVVNAPFDVDTVLRFGGSDPSHVLHGQWWRLLTSTFVHVTVLHLLINMWCLWNLGFFGEPLLGKPGLVAVYLLTGAAGMLLSLLWSVFTRQPDIVAGASGAIFGIAGILIVLLSNRNLGLPWHELQSLRRSVVWFAVLNLAIGMAPRLLPAFPAAWLGTMHLDLRAFPRVDNTAHLGGFLSGLALGWPLFSRMTMGKSVYRARQRLVFSCAVLLLCLFGYGIARFAGPPGARL